MLRHDVLSLPNGCRNENKGGSLLGLLNLSCRQVQESPVR